MPRKKPTEKRYFLDRDSSGHWYLVDVAHRSEWETWTNLDEDDPASWDAPEYAERLPGAPCRVEFGSPKIK